MNPALNEQLSAPKKPPMKIKLDSNHSDHFSGAGKMIVGNYLGTVETIKLPMLRQE